MTTYLLVGLFVLLTAIRIFRALRKDRFLMDSYLSYTWMFFLAFVVSEFLSFQIGIWVLALVSFWAIREYFSLVDIRLQDRLAVLGAYISVPFMYYFIQIDWYGMFIVSIPVYAFLTIPFLVALGGTRTEGTVLSVGIVDFGLFLFVFCIGHIGYLLLYSVWMAVVLILNVLLCDATACICNRFFTRLWSRIITTYIIAAPLTVATSIALCGWAEIPRGHAAVLALMTPMLVIMGRHTGTFVKADLGIQEDLLIPGRGQILDNLQSLFYAAPVMFHYIRYFLK